VLAVIALLWITLFVAAGLTTGLAFALLIAD
jgi:hypothetical protein